MSDRYKLENALLAVESKARVVLELDSADEGTEVPVPLAFAMMGMRDSLQALDDLRSAIRARQKFEGSLPA